MNKVAFLAIHSAKSSDGYERLSRFSHKKTYIQKEDVGKTNNYVSHKNIYKTQGMRFLIKGKFDH